MDARDSGVQLLRCLGLRPDFFFSLEIRARVRVQPKLFTLGSSRESLRVRVRGAAYVRVQLCPYSSSQMFSAKKILAREVTQQQICIFFTVYVGSAAYVCVQCLIGVSQVLPMSASSPCVQLCPCSSPEMFPRKKSSHAKSHRSTSVFMNSKLFLLVLPMFVSSV